MSGPAYTGYVIENKTVDQLDGSFIAKQAAPLLYLPDDQICLCAIEHGKHIWLSIQFDATDYDIQTISWNAAPDFAPAVAKRHSTHVWAYTLMSTSSFLVGASRYATDDSTTSIWPQESDVPEDFLALVEQGEEDMATWMVEDVNTRFAAALNWDPVVLPTNRSEQGVIPPGLDDLPKTFLTELTDPW